MLTITDYFELTPLTAGTKAMSEEEFGNLLSQSNQLPENVRDTLAGKETAEALLTIEKEYGLQREQTEKISKVLRDVLLGTIPARMLRDRVRKETVLPPENIDKIVTNITKNIITPVYFSLQKMKPAPKTPSSAPPPAPLQKKREVKHSSPNNVVDLRKSHPSAPPPPPPPDRKGEEAAGKHGPMPQ